MIIVQGSSFKVNQRLVGIGLAIVAATALMAQSPPGISKNQKDFNELKKQLDAANDAYYKPLEDAKSPEESAKIRLDPAKDPKVIFLPKYLEFRKKVTKDLVIGPEVEKSIFNMAFGNKLLMKECLDNLSTRFIQSPVLNNYMYLFQESTYYMDEKPVKALPYLRKIQNQAKSKLIQASALYAAAGVLKRTNQKQSRALYSDLIRRYASTRYAKLGKASLFELDNLQIGMVAPDFEIEDENGSRWKLSDYRGKVIVLDFWGFW